MTKEERIERSKTTIFKAVFPNTTNHYHTLFGGTAMQLMDEMAFITATRYSRQQMVTVSSDRIDFKKPILTFEAFKKSTFLLSYLADALSLVIIRTSKLKCF